MSLITRRVVAGHGKAVRAELKAMSTRVARGDALDLGDRGAAVKGLQEHLRAAGLLKGKLTSTFGSRTEAAVQALQRETGLAQTGVVDAATLAKVKHLDLFVKGGFRPAATVGQRGRDIGKAERQLKKLKFKPGKVDGIFNKATAAAVKRFQHRHHLKATGKLDHRTGVAINKATKAADQSAFSKKVLATARKYVGFHEKGDNGNPFSKYFHRGNEAWCADFVSYCYTKAGKKLNEPWTPRLLETLHKNGTYTRNKPKPGDIVMFDWHPGSGYKAEHTGLVEKVFKRGGRTWIQTIEGNSSDAVRRKTYPVSSSSIAGFGTIR